MIKRILVILAVFLVTTVGCVSADSSFDNYEVLNHLNIVTEDYENMLKMRTVSQKDFLSAIVNIVADENVPSDKVMDYAKSQNIIPVINTTEMNSGISYERALNLSLNVLGYQKVIEMNGNNVTAVMKIAGNIKLTKGITLSAGDKLTGSAFITLLSNLLEADMLSINYAASNNFAYSQSKEKLLSHYMNITKVETMITKTYETSLYSEDGLEEGRIGIGDNSYKINYTYSPDVLGKQVYAYVKNVGGQDEVVYVSVIENKTKQIEILDKDIIDVSDNFQTIRYDNNNRNLTLKLNPALILIYNGKYYTGYTKDDLMPRNGKLVCVDNDADDEYDIVFVYSYETVVVENISIANKKITNHMYYQGCIDTLDLSDSTVDVNIFNEVGSTNLSEIKTNDILSVAQSKSANKLIYIYISKEKVSGSLKSIDLEENLIKINEDEYPIDEAYLDALNELNSKLDKLVLGNDYTLYLDYFGNVSYGKSDSKAGYEYAFVLKQNWVTKKGTSKLRLLTTDNEWETLYLAEKVKINNEYKKPAEYVYNELGGTSLTPQLVLIKRDEEGNIAGIKTATISSGYNPNEFTKTTSITRNYWEQDSSFNCRHYLSSDVIVLLRPELDTNLYEEDEYEMTTSKYFKADQSYTYIAYNVDEFGYPEVFEIKHTIKSDENTIYVNRVIQGLNSDGEAVRIIKANYSGIENLSIQEKPGAINTEIKSGDIVKIKLRNGKIVGATVLYSANSVRTLKAPDDGSAVHNEITIMGIVKTMDLDRKMIIFDFGTEEVPIKIDNEADIEIYDPEQKQYTIGSIIDICKGNYARIMMNQNQVRSIAIFE